MVDGAVAMEGDSHLVAAAGDGARLGGAAVFLFRDQNVVVATGGVRLQVKALEGEHDLLSSVHL